MSAIVDRLICCLIDWGPGMILAALVLYGLYRLVGSIGLKVVAALEKPAYALELQAKSMEKLTNSLDDYVCRDRSEHREIMMLQKVILDRIEGLKHGQN